MLATDIVVLDIQSLSSIADYFVICSADNIRQLGAIAEQVERTLRDEGVRPSRREGQSDSGWIVLDYSSVMVHLLTAELRDFYRLEELWSEAPRLLVIQ